MKFNSEDECAEMSIKNHGVRFWGPLAAIMSVFKFLVTMLQKDRPLASLELLRNPSQTNAFRTPDTFTNRFHFTKVRKQTNPIMV